MSYFKISRNSTISKAMARFHGLIWVLIYGGLLTLVFGLFVEGIDDATGELMVLGGGIAAALGVVLIYLRSRIK
jgi:formate hydrogenlyase subunit 3/multisubunit Na+/H+ antiporter MnhD subunit